MEII
jgi:ubiquitin C-terminal hydrolase